MRRREVPAEREGRHEHVPRRARARRRQPAEIDREQQDHQEPDPELGHRQAQEGEQLARPVPEAVHPHRRQDPAGDPDEEREGHGDHAQHQRVRQPGQVQLEDGGPVVERAAEVALEEVRHEAHVLHSDRSIEAELSLQRVDVRLAGARLDQQRGRVAGDAHEQEDRQRQEEQREQRIAEALEDERLHRRPLLSHQRIIR